MDQVLETAAPPAAAPPAAAPPAGEQQQDTGTTVTTSDNPFATLPENWRTSLLESAGFEGEEIGKRAGQLERVLDMGTLVKNYFNAQDKIRKGELSTGLPENPTEEQMAEWRTANGVPATPNDYELSLEDGLVLGEDDERILEGVFNVAHSHNLSTTVANELVNTMLKGRELEQQALQQQHGIQKQQTEQQLRKAWGGEYQTNVNIVEGLINRLPANVKQVFAEATMADGRAVFNSPEMMVFFADIARELNPGGTLVPNSNNPVQAITDEIAKLEARMGDDDWHKDTAAQQRYQQLVTAREQYASRT